jgi:cytochrome c-type biogenesis protein CcmE
MRGLKKKQRIQVIGLIGVTLAVAAVLIGYGFREGINLFRSPTQILAAAPPAGEVFRIGGLIAEGTLKREPNNFVTFTVTDGNASVPLEYTGLLPDLVAEKSGVVALGTYENNTFQATEILAKHDETYMPKEVIEALKEQGVYQEPVK